MDDVPGHANLLLASHIASQDYEDTPAYSIQTDPVYPSLVVEGSTNHEHALLDAHDISGENHITILMDKSDGDDHGEGLSLDPAGIESGRSLSLDHVGIVPTHGNNMNLGPVRIGAADSRINLNHTSGIETAHSVSLNASRTKPANSIIINTAGIETANHITLSAAGIAPSRSISINVAPRQHSSRSILDSSGIVTAKSVGLDASRLETDAAVAVLVNKAQYEERQNEARLPILQPRPGISNIHVGNVGVNPASNMTLLIDKTSSSGNMSGVAEETLARTSVHGHTEKEGSRNTTVLLNKNSNVQERLEEAQLIINLQKPRRQSEVDVTVATEEPAVTMVMGDGASPGALQEGLVVGDSANLAAPQEGGESEVITIERKEYHECYICKMQFKSITALFKHRVAHNEQVENTFSCDICSQVFSDHLQLAKHRYLHIEVRVYRCGICLDTFETEDKYNFHVRVHDREGPYVCNICSQVFDKKLTFLDHHYKHKPRGMPPKNILQCETCKRVFPDAQKLKRHALSHSGDKFFRCSVCQKTFVERSKLTRHMITHSGKREHVCTVCGKTFTLKFNLHQHMNIHKGVRPFKCGVCGKDFVQRIVMQRHMKVHEMLIVHTPVVE